MSDPLTLGLASTAVGLVNGTISLLKSAKESAKESDDHELKDRLSEVFDQILDLKEAIYNLTQENTDLRAKLESKLSVRRDPRSKNYLAEGDEDPLCPVCWERDGKQIHLRPALPTKTGTLFRQCFVCKHQLREWIE